MTQHEARVLKTANKELRAKLHKLTEILTEKKTEIEHLTLVAAEKESRLLEAEEHRKKCEVEKLRLDNTLCSLKDHINKFEEREKEMQRKVLVLQNQLLIAEENNRRTEVLNKKLVIERDMLEEKITQLSKENRTIFERSSKLLSQLQISETKWEIEKSEKQVLQVKIDYLMAELHKLKQFGQTGLTEKSGDSPNPASSSGKQRPQSLQIKAGDGQDNLVPKERQLPQRIDESVPQKQLITGGTKLVEPKKAIELHHHPERNLLGSTGGHRSELVGRTNVKRGSMRQGRVSSDEKGGAMAGQREGELAPGDTCLTTVECPICGKLMHSHQGNDYGVLLHVEHCIRLSEVRS